MIRLKALSRAYSSEIGSAFFYILLGVVLFGVLAFTVSRGMRGQQTNSMSSRQAELAVSDVLDYSQKVEHAISRLRRNGCSENDLSFYSDQFANPTHYNNASAPSDKSCDIFLSTGGGISWQAPPKNIQKIGSSEYLISGALQIEGLGTSDASSSADQEMSIITIVPSEVCLIINDKFGIVNPGGDPPGTGETINANYSIPSTNWQAIGWGFINNQTIGVSGKAIELYKHPTGCYIGSLGSHYYYHVLVER